jgi:hypothetical protein
MLCYGKLAINLLSCKILVILKHVNIQLLKNASCKSSFDTNCFVNFVTKRGIVFLPRLIFLLSDKTIFHKAAFMFTNTFVEKTLS